MKHLILKTLILAAAILLADCAGPKTVRSAVRKPDTQYPAAFPAQPVLVAQLRSFWQARIPQIPKPEIR